MNDQPSIVTESPNRKLHAVAGALAAGIVSCLYYGIDRTIAYLRHGAPNPLGTMNSPRIDYFWRIALAGFLGSLVFMAVSWGIKRVQTSTIERMTMVLLVALAFCACLAAVFP
jgi:membrane protein DedA with SNARE-associated domain